MDDLRVLWMRDRVYTAFGLTDPQLFEDLMTRDDGEAEDLILHFLNQASDEEAAATLFFYRRVVPEEVEVEIGEPAAAPHATSSPPGRGPVRADLRLQCRLQTVRVARSHSNSPLGKAAWNEQSQQTLI